jgi:PBP1b-binding outer membrane lipoprotein LpoB
VKKGLVLIYGGALALALCCALAALGQDQTQKPAPAPLAISQPIQVPATPEQQAKVDAAWKDIEIAQLRLQLVVTQVLAEMNKDTYYDFNQQKFFRRTPPSQKPVVPAILPKKDSAAQ